MSLKDFFLALCVIVIWGVSFIVIRLGLNGVPPMLLGALRFLLAAFPAVFFVRRPAVPLRWLIAYGLTPLFGQFVFLFSGIYAGMPAGLASLVLQSQAFFTLLLAGLFLGERVRVQGCVGLLVAAGGLLLIGLDNGRDITFAGFGLTLLAALMWACGNIVTKKIGQVDLVGLVVWSSLVPPLPFLALSLWLEGPARIGAALHGIGPMSLFAVAYLAFIATLAGYGLWSKLLLRYPANQVAPFSLLVPIVGLSTAALVLGERWSMTQMIGAALVLAGLAINVFGTWLRARLAVARGA